MKRLLTALLLIYTATTFAQQNDELNFFNIDNDTIIFYLDNVGSITTKSNAQFYRKSQIDNKNFIYKGIVEDFYLNKQKAFQYEFQNGNLAGKTMCYYPNGQLKYQGFYKNSQKDSTWNFYYENGNIEKDVNFKSDIPYVTDYYTVKGKCVFLNGNGKYTGKIISGYKQATEYKVSGNIKNGKMEGKWNWRNVKVGNNTYATEYFENGKFIKGNSYGLEYTEDPKISLLGFNLHENVDVLKFFAVLNSKSQNFQFSKILKYKNSNDLNKTFTPELIDFLNKANNKYNLTDYWCFIQFKINKSNKINSVNIFSNENKISNDIKQFISQTDGFETAQVNNENIDCSVYLCLLLEDGKIYIPKYSLNSDFDIMNLIPNN